MSFILAGTRRALPQRTSKGAPLVPLGCQAVSLTAYVSWLKFA